MECIVCHHCKVFWYQPKGQLIDGVVHPPCQNQVRVAKRPRPPKEYTTTSQQMAA